MITCWGVESFGEITGAPVDVAFGKVSVGTIHTCAIRDDETLTCWGMFRYNP